MTQHYTGYIEGYYGRLPSWSERLTLVDNLATVGQHYYWYAPKEDPLHRVQWRQPYDDSWLTAFATFCKHSRRHGVSVIAGVAPGLDFDFSALDRSAANSLKAASANTASANAASASTSQGSPNDFASLVAKARALESAGATVVALLLDDIDADFYRRRGAFTDEGVAHAELANALASVLTAPLIVVPRIYANTLVAEAPDYLRRFADTLHRSIAVSLCGHDVVAQTITTDDFSRYADFSLHRIIAWDNLYANDYCPRRLFTGPWVGRDGLRDVMLNPTGMIHTDCLLLALTSSAGKAARRHVLSAHGVPECFAALEHYAWLPPFGAVAGRADPAEAVLFDAEQAAALEHLLWRWKTPLAREWYPFLMGLKTDLLVASGRLPDDRIRKTQTPALARRLL